MCKFGFYFAKIVQIVLIQIEELFSILFFRFAEPKVGVVLLVLRNKKFYFRLLFHFPVKRKFLELQLY